jgi:hypothetical protein
MISTIIDSFISRECRHGLHQNCYGEWSGLGFKIVCCCECGHFNKNDLASESVEGPLANAKGNESF